MSLSSAAGRLTAVLGPTNTGKTYLAIERMLGHESGMIGFPLRLLARENYDRIVRIKGAHQVALITGEEKILPPGARYFVCTVESMPVERTVSFLAVDEIQMAADPERGHFFTDRLLNARGTNETMLLGADTIRPVLNRLLPDIDIVARPRFSKLSYVGPKKATRLPRRSAVVGFSANEVYAIAELIRRQRGGTAIVMGALSPRTRNAQVEMFQSGEVEYLVATDAIGMGLNMDVNHVWFASLRKYDGRNLRPLRNVELAQIAGRAGRHMNDGTFGTTSDVGGLDPETVEAIENHRFDPLRDVQWRNSALDFLSVSALIGSLNRPPPHAALQRVREQDDQLALQTLGQRSEFLPRLHAPSRVKLLWEVCQVPDFRKTMTEEHTHLLGELFQHLTQGGERLPEDWIESHVKRLERYDGDIDTLMARIAHVRTWTYISHRADWIQRAAHWQERARAIEDKLSDVLHQRLTQRFVDRRAALLVRRLHDEGEMTTSVAEAGEVIVEGEHLGRIEGFRFVPDTTEGQTDQKAVLTAALRALRENLPTRLQAFTSANDGELVFDSQLRVCWGGGPIARLVASGDTLAPKVEALPSDLLDGPAREEVRKRAATWVETRIRLGLSELMDARATQEQLPPGARGIIFQLCEHLGVLPRRPIEQQLSELTEEDRKALAKLGVRVGVYSLYFPSMLKPVPIRLRAGLWMVAHNRDSIPPLPAEGRTSIDLPRDAEREFYAAIGYLPLGAHAIRADMVERLAAMARQSVRESREAARRAQQQERKAEGEKEKPAASELAAPEAPKPSADEITEWAIVAAAFGESEPEPQGEAGTAETSAGELAAEAPQAPEAVATAAEEVTAETPMAEPVTAEVSSEAAPSHETTAEQPVGTDETAASEPHAPAAQPAESATEETSGASAQAEEGHAPQPRKDPPKQLPPGHFRATPQMMSLVGCSEPQMADVLRGLGYRVLLPTEEGGPHSFSVKPRFLREREEQRERQRQQQRDHREQRRRERPERPNERQFFADSPRREGPNRGPKPHGPRPDQGKGGGRENRSRDDRPQGPRQRRDDQGPALRLYATTEKKGEANADSPFAKLLELKLGGKK
ncbi:ATP-dependent RNA helicase SUPV3L1/SUV3 [Enhydrobacter aerosaccus]|uniref:ATP-dependent RNA helicase SUPV3L1/SUV3 n=1 Tax=Enhydrobacter aerosaccus TaxID=225324 RepID=A0A1T4QHV1_9HYPH|nr:helicase-related protein [Enhydrobacter aerosaccus]SKA03216.1 ATP-dependent RNA helicase SUPV3L1/SUV3 [Enhydrobacter aerosaccus]